MTTTSIDEALFAELRGILDDSELSFERKTQILIAATVAYTPQAQQEASQAAGGSFWTILLQLLVQFLPMLLKLLGGIN